MFWKRTDDYYYLKLETHYLDIPYYNQKRRIRVLLPKDYKKDVENAYPVLYMHDGQNVFYSKEAFVGHSWKVIPAIKNNKELPKMIIVAVDNANENRLNEYSPWPTDQTKTEEFQNVGGDGALHGEWFVNELKPFIDDNYRTLPDRKNTLLAGSSMGGIMAAYMGSKYPEVFGVLGVFSLASWFNEEQFLSFIKAHPLNPDTKVYIQVGTNEGDDTDASFIDGKMNQQYIDCNLRYYNNLLKMNHPIDNIWLRIMADEEHHELYWARHFPEFLRYGFDIINGDN
ncbi:alpha/beta hydrolase [Ruoffia tabacinasalis]|uniref:Alpha/beta hydrolase n=1 Tax=Ruoffia tabacinasalis TaxID=87458 RepID=A0ABS0LJU7_9LACT|nr:alpha/beta hydrolase-fold protein [Ruoffia tabacinasalis]MBG9978367.1 alpha/beta hydrolase [Ruoffia tabacinasalis]